MKCLSVDLGETPKQKPLNYITGYDFGLHLYTYNQRHSLQQRRRVFAWMFLQVQEMPLIVETDVIPPQGKLKKRKVN